MNTSMHSKLAMKCVYSLSHRSRCRCSCDPLADWGKLEHGGCTDAQFVTESNGRISELSADIESSFCHSPSSQEDIAAVGVWTCHCAYSAGAQMNEEEIPEDIEGWVVSVITWVRTLECTPSLLSRVWHCGCRWCITSCACQLRI